MLDAWSVIDSVHRMRELVQRVPRWRKPSASRQIFLRATASTENLRNAIQHLDTESESLLRSGRPPFGALTWITPDERNTGRMYIQSFIPGQLTGADPNTMVEAPKDVPTKVDYIELWASDHRASISDAYRSVEKLILAMEASIGLQTSKSENGPSDMHVWILVDIQTAED